MHKTPNPHTGSRSPSFHPAKLVIGLSICLGTPFCSGDFAAVYASQAPQSSFTLELLQEDANSNTRPKNRSSQRYKLVERYTAHVLEPFEVKLGIEAELGLPFKTSISTNLLAGLFGVPSFAVKWQAYESEKNIFAILGGGALLNKDTLIWKDVRDQFSRLSIEVFQPGVAWTHTFSDRLKVHTYWSVSLGNVKATLSDKGRRLLWDTKHPDIPYDQRDLDESPPIDSPDGGSESELEPTTTRVNQSNNAEKTSFWAQRTVQAQSLAGLASDTFQVTGEITRDSGHKVLITNRIKKIEFERLSAKSIDITIAQQWVWENFQIRLGGGIQYLQLGGFDLDDEKVNEKTFLPASDMTFYWRF